jgi:hypothetical protein
MAGEEDERIFRLGRIEFRDKQRDLPPIGIDLGRHSDLRARAFLDAGEERGAVAIGDSRHRHLRQLVASELGRAAPDRRYAHLVKMFVRAHMDDAERARPRGKDRDLFGGDALDEQDLAREQALSEIRLASLAHRDELAFDAAWPRRRRHGMGDAAEHSAFDEHFRASR